MKIDVRKIESVRSLNDCKPKSFKDSQFENKILGGEVNLEKFFCT